MKNGILFENYRIENGPGDLMSGTVFNSGRLFCRGAFPFFDDRAGDGVLAGFLLNQTIVLALPFGRALYFGGGCG